MSRFRIACLFLCAACAAASAPAAASGGVIAPIAAGLLVDRGDDLQSHGHDREAIKAYTRAIRLDPTNAYAWASRCESKWVLDENESAVHDCLRAVKLDPASAYAYRQLALAQTDAGDRDGALASANRAIALDPSLSYGFSVRCRVHNDRREHAAALQDCDRALAMDPKSHLAHAERTRAELGTQDYRAAEADATWSILNAADSTPYYNRALARLHTGDYDGAIADIDTYLKRHPDDADSYYEKARIENAAGNASATTAAAAKARALYLQSGDREGADKALAFLGQTSPSESPANAANLWVSVAIGAGIAFGIVFFLAFLVWVMWRIMDRAGIPGPVALVVLVPYIGFPACLAILAFVPWKLRPRPARPSDTLPA